MEFIKTYESFKNERFGGGLDHGDTMGILDIAAQYTSDAHAAANQMWSDVDDLVGYLKSDHIPKKYHKAFDKSVESYKKRHKLESVEVNEEEKDFEPHMMYDPETGKGYKADTYEDHVRMDKMGYVHEKPEKVDEAKFVNSYDTKVNDAETEKEVLKIYPKAKFFVGKMTHFFGELEPNLFFKAYYPKYYKQDTGKSVKGDFKITSVYSQKGSKYVELMKESVESLIIESFKSSIMRGLHGQEAGTRWRSGLAKEIANKYNVKLDQITDGDFEILSDPSQWFKGKYKGGNHLGFFVDDNPKFAAYLKKNPRTWNGVKPGVVKNPGLLLSLVRGKVGLWHGLTDNPGSTYSRYRKGSEERYGLLAKEWDLDRAYNGFEGKPLQKVTQKNLKEAPTKVYVLDLDKLKAKYDASELKSDRADQKRGATALQDPKDIKKANMNRYTQILKDRAAETDIDKDVKEGIDKITKQIQDAVNKGTMNQYGNFVVGISTKNKREVSISDATSFLKSLLDDYQRYVDYGKKAQEPENQRPSGRPSYYDEEVKNYALRIKQSLEKIDNYTYGW